MVKAAGKKGDFSSYVLYRLKGSSGANRKIRDEKDLSVIKMSKSLNKCFSCM